MFSTFNIVASYQCVLRQCGKNEMFHTLKFLINFSLKFSLIWLFWRQRTDDKTCRRWAVTLIRRSCSRRPRSQGVVCPGRRSCRWQVAASWTPWHRRGSACSHVTAWCRTRNLPPSAARTRYVTSHHRGTVGAGVPWTHNNLGKTPEPHYGAKGEPLVPNFTFVGRTNVGILSKFRILARNLCLRGVSFAQFLRNSHHLYASIGSFQVFSLVTFEGQTPKL